MPSEADNKDHALQQQQQDEPKAETPKRNKKNKKRRSAASKRKDNHEPVAKVHVLLLTFEYHDLGKDLDKETEEVKRAFKRLNYTVYMETIKMNCTASGMKEILQRFLQPENPGSRDNKPGPGNNSGLSNNNPGSSNDTLFIIYYNGHGGVDDAGQFTLSSHSYADAMGINDQIPSLWDKIRKIVDTPENSKRDLMLKEARGEFAELQPNTDIAWGGIHDTVMEAPCDTLMILDCCQAGLASAVSLGLRDPDPVHEYRKELIAACTWGNETGLQMSGALCTALKSISAANGVSTVVRKMNNVLAEPYLKNAKEKGERYLVRVPQAAHYVLRRTETDRIILGRL